MITSLRMFHRYLTMTYPKIPDATLHIRSSKTAKKLPTYFNVADIERLLDSFQDSDMDIFHKALLEVLYGCGLRVSELTHLRLNMTHLEQGFLKVLGKGEKERMVPMHQRSVHALQQYLEFVRPQWVKQRSPFVFLNSRGQNVSRQYVHNLIKSKLTALGLDERLSAHSFRHSFATHLLDQRRKTTMKTYKRVFAIVVDSLGVGAAPNAKAYGDEGCDTLGHIAMHMENFHIPNLAKLGLANLHPMQHVASVQEPMGYYTKMIERSVGKDTMTGHWEMMGLYIDTPFQTFTESGFPKELLDELSKRTGHKWYRNFR